MSTNKNNDAISLKILERLDSLTERMNSLEEKIGETRSLITATATANAEDFPCKANTREDVTKNISKNFDFERVANIMKFLDWRWANRGVPTSQEIREEAKRMLFDAWMNLDATEFKEDGSREWYIRCGGLEVWVCEEYCNDVDGGIQRFGSLKFVVEEWTVEG